MSLDLATVVTLVREAARDLENTKTGLFSYFSNSASSTTVRERLVRLETDLVKLSQRGGNQQQLQQYQQPAPLAAAAPPKPRVSFAVDVYQAYADCTPVLETLRQLPELRAAELVDITRTTTRTSTARALVYVFFTHTGRWLDDLRGQAALLTLAPQYDCLVIVTIRATTDVAGLPSMHTPGNTLAEMLGGRLPAAAVYLLFEHRERVYDSDMSSVYTKDAIKYNERSLKDIVAVLRKAGMPEPSSGWGFGF